MNIDRKHVLAIAGGSLLLGGCAIDPQTGDFIQYEMGESVKQTMMAQVIDPDPQYDSPIHASSGEQASDAIERYRSDNVKEPETQRVRSATGGRN